MKLIETALSRPISVVVTILAILFFAVLSIRNMKIDIFPTFGLPTIYVAQPYGGLSPEQMESFVTNYYEYHFLYVTGVKAVESKSVQGACLIKIIFHEGTNMSQAAAEVVGYVNRSRAFMPPGTVPPFVTRFDAGSVPVGQLVFTSETRTLGEIQDLALFKVRPMFSTLPGVSAPPPFGGSQKTVVIKVDPEKIKQYDKTPDEIVKALAAFNTITPAGNLRIGDQMLITPQNTVVDNFKELENIPLKLGSGASIYLRDIASVELGSDVSTGYALINGARSVYIPVTKRADASTWDVVKRVKAALPDMQAAVPEDIKVSYAFDQSSYVINALYSVLFEGGLGALLTGLMVLLFLRDFRGALIVVLTIPLALLSSVICLYLLGQTINIMTLGGLALSVGILVDEATVTVENIHRHFAMEKSRVRAILDACQEIVRPKLLILLAILAVFAPALAMSGVPKGMFLPMSLAVGFAMIASFLLSMTFVPVLAVWLMRQGNHQEDTSSTAFARFRRRYVKRLEKRSKRSWLSLGLYSLLVLLGLYLGVRSIGVDIFPKVDSGQLQVRLRMPTGTRVERTEEAAQRLLKTAESLVGKGNIEISSAFVGTQPSSYPVNLIHLWTSGPHEAVLKIKLRAGVHYPIARLKEELRKGFLGFFPGSQLSFEPGDLVEQVLNLGSSNPIEVAITGKNLEASLGIAQKLAKSMQQNLALRDVQIATPLQYPGISIAIDRVKSGQLGLSVSEIARSMVAATSSSRFTEPNYWRDPVSGNAYQVQVEYPQYRMNSTEEVEMIPVGSQNGQKIHLRDVASWSRTQSPGEYDRLNQQRFITITANVEGQDLQRAVRSLNQSITDLGPLPTGVQILQRGQVELLGQTRSELQLGLLIAIIVIFLMLVTNFQSFRTALISLAILPAVIMGAVLLLLLTGHSLNIQSYMGTIMAVGVATANAILYVTNAEQLRRSGFSDAHLMAAENRLRPILMTSLAMIVGMIPMSLGLGEGGDQIAPLGVAVIGGLFLSMISTLFFLPLIFERFTRKQGTQDVSLNPNDWASRYFEPTKNSKI